MLPVLDSFTLVASSVRTTIDGALLHRVVNLFSQALGMTYIEMLSSIVLVLYKVRTRESLGYHRNDDGRLVEEQSNVLEV